MRHGQEGHAIGGAQLGFPILVGVPFLFQEGERGNEEERGKERGGRRPLPSPIRTSPWGGVRPPFEAFLSFLVWPIKAQYEFP